jgi:hypothetical protein
MIIHSEQKLPFYNLAKSGENGHTSISSRGRKKLFASYDHLLISSLWRRACLLAGLDAGTGSQQCTPEFYISSNGPEII